MPRATESLRRQWGYQREDMQESLANGEPTADDLPFEIKMMDALLALPVGKTFDAQEIRKRLEAEHYETKETS